MTPPLTRKWSPKLYETLNNFVLRQVRRNALITQRIPDARTMPNLAALTIGTAKRMNAAIMFFDFENFTNTTSRLSPENTLMI